VFARSRKRSDLLVVKPCVGEEHLHAKAIPLESWIDQREWPALHTRGLVKGRGQTEGVG
jgi:hypothetical protein